MQTVVFCDLSDRLLGQMNKDTAADCRVTRPPHGPSLTRCLDIRVRDIHLTCSPDAFLSICVTASRSFPHLRTGLILGLVTDNADASWYSWE